MYEYQGQTSTNNRSIFERSVQQETITKYYNKRGDLISETVERIYFEPPTSNAAEPTSTSITDGHGFNNRDSDFAF